MIIKDPKKLVENEHKRGNKLMVIGQPLAGKDVPKKTYISSINLMSPLNMIDLLQKHNVTSTVKIINHFPIDYNRNSFVDECMDIGADYLMFMDMDMTWPRETFNYLFELISDENPVVSGMYFIKKEPFNAVCGRYVEWDDELSANREKLDELGFVSKDDKQLLSWRSFTYFGDTPFYADVIGMGCVLMKSSVIEKLRNQTHEEVKDEPYRYFRYSPDPRKSSTHNCISEDMFFCARLKKAGIPILIDPRIQCGHLMEMESNKWLYENQRDMSFQIAGEREPERFKEVQSKILDVRGENVTI